MTNTQLGLFRHGQTDWNINFLLQGTTDIPMNEVGFAQVRLAAAHIDPSQWDILLTSPLTRARQSSNILIEELALPEAIEDELLIERSFGEAEGLSHEQWKMKYSSLDEIPGGESRSELAERSQRLLEKIASDFAGKRVLAVSHGALIRTLIAIASEEKLPREGERLGNASLNVVGHAENRWEILSYSLDPLGYSDQK